MSPPTGATYAVKSSGPSTDPCGTPYRHGDVRDVCRPSLMYCCRSVWYERSQLAAAPSTPKSLWLMVSKAAEMYVQADERCCLLVVGSSLDASITCRSAISVECPRRQADCRRTKFDDRRRVKQVRSEPVQHQPRARSPSKLSISSISAAGNLTYARSLSRPGFFGTGVT